MKKSTNNISYEIAIQSPSKETEWSTPLYSRGNTAFTAFPWQGGWFWCSAFL